MIVREIFIPRRLTASGTLLQEAGQIGGFFCTTAGTLQITSGGAAGGSDIVSSFSVTAGTYYPLPFDCPSGAYAVLGGGAVGTFGLCNN